ncbi:MAG: dihydrolipoyl dehydrogenase [Anaerolineales bacterium]|jgi:dihydrolipoamide dehydrogenase
MSKRDYDVIIIGAGPGGYIAAERAGAMGKSVLLIEKKHLGGICLNEGCIPSKTLLHAAKLFVQAKGSEEYGVLVDNPRFDLTTVMAHKKKVVQTLRDGVAYQMERFNVEVLHGMASIVDRRTIEVEGQRYSGKNILIATGSTPIHLPVPGADQPHVVTSSELLNIDRLPQSLIVIGGGVIGCEFASFFSNVGVEVTVIELLPEIISNIDAEIARLLRRSMKKVSFHLDSEVVSIGVDELTFKKQDQLHTIPAELVLMSVGRQPNVGGLGLERIDLDLDRVGIRVNDVMQTNIPGVYAIGDVTGKSMLAHSASRMGEVAVNHMFGYDDTMRYHAIPWVVYTHPEVASVGLSEAQAREKGLEVKIAKMPMTINGRFLAENIGKRGLCKMVVDSKTCVLLGVHMIGSTCSEMIFGAAAMIEDEFRVKDIKEVVFPHPTVSEMLRDTIFEV